LLIEKERALQERDRLDVEWRNLILEQGALTEHNRIESLVKEKLDMYRPGPDEEVVVQVK
jgi:cell division protein FtsL